MADSQHVQNVIREKMSNKGNKGKGKSAQSGNNKGQQQKNNNQKKQNKNKPNASKTTFLHLPLEVHKLVFFHFADDLHQFMVLRLVSRPFRVLLNSALVRVRHKYVIL
jgi:hypothetical protein